MNEYRDLGWANGWDTTEQIPQEVKDCRAAMHKCRDVDIGGGNRGTNHVVSCDTCRIKYHYDSSD